MPADRGSELLVIEPAGIYARRRPAVVDASVIASILFEEDRRPQALAALEALELHAPDLLDHELVSVALKKSRAGFEDTAREGLRLLAELEIARHRVDPHAQWVRASDNGLSGYDAAYLALAAELGYPLVTFDQKLGAAARSLLQGD